MHNHTTVYPSDTEGLHKLACYLMRSPVNLSRLRYHPDSQLILYQPKSGHDFDDDGVVDPLEFLARVLIHIPQPNQHGVHFYGAYANRVRSTYQAEGTAAPSQATGAVLPRRALSKRWAELIFRIYETCINYTRPDGGGVAVPSHTPIPSLEGAGARSFRAPPGLDWRSGVFP